MLAVCGLRLVCLRKTFGTAVASGFLEGFKKSAAPKEPPVSADGRDEEGRKVSRAD
ncbi:hypothetical protein B4135_1351 [Caldibacillus debilis]|uniref:Uncharacterized protein n=1 Tax=Caldibacillus debilis TaxID=301148 RepID=A0A150MCR2_9BACI|nr:hypothetical protein B4135_1351 [Caldibacillus debilis]